ncbi:hypothetical protein Tco_1281941, partial [Tanacetum coccineum]
MELVLERTQQGTSYEVSVRTEGVEELKRKVKIKGEKKETLLTLRQKLVKMEILLEPTSNKLMVVTHWFTLIVLSALRRSGNENMLSLMNLIHVLERFNTLAGNPVKEILLKLNLPDHRSILTDSKVTPTKHGRMPKPYLSPRFIANCFNAEYLKKEVK